MFTHNTVGVNLCVDPPLNTKENFWADTWADTQVCPYGNSL